MKGLKWLARLRRHDWTASIIELVIVVVGILVALQVTHWNQERVDRARAHRYYERLHGELVADRLSLDQTVALWNTVSAYGQAAIAYAERGDRVAGSNWKTLLAYYQASQLKTIEEAAAILDDYKRSDTLLQNLRYWMSTLKVSVIVIDGTRKDADRLVSDVEAAQGR